jgi:hypothetical protein
MVIGGTSKITGFELLLEIVTRRAADRWQTTHPWRAGGMAVMSLRAYVMPSRFT